MSIYVGITNYGGFLKFVDPLRPTLPPDVELQIIDDVFGDLEKRIRRYERDNTLDVLVSSGITADTIQRMNIAIPLVRISVDGFDILNALDEALKNSSNVALITRSEIPNVDSLVKTVKGSLRPIIYDSPENLGPILQSLYAEGIRDVIGSSLVMDQAKMYGLRGHFIWSFDSVRQAVEQAIALARARKALAAKANTLDYLLDYSAEGIIITDKNGIITEFNNSAQRILGRSRKNVLGRYCEEVLPNTQLHIVMKEKRTQFNCIQDFGNVKIVTNRSPIISNQEVIGALATFFSVATINQAGNNIRRTLSTDNFFAKECFSDFKTENSAMKELIQTGERYAKSRFPILIHGAEGTEKGALAQSIHNASVRKNEPFVHIDCSAIQKNMIEGDMLGYEDFAANGTRRSTRRGFLENANGGTLFLEEIAQLPLKVQARLVGIIENKQFMRLGGERPIPLDIRIVASTGQSLRPLVDSGEFNAELYFCLNVLELHLPNLADRKEDIPLLIRTIIQQERSDLTRNEIASISNCPTLNTFSYPGNIRQLRSIIERLSIDYSPGMNIDQIANEIIAAQEGSASIIVAEETGERQEIQEALLLSNGNRNRAAEILGLSRTTLWRKMRELGIET